jgi:hypothetical protein
MQISWDPRVVEVLMKPMTTAEIAAAEPFIEKVLFDSAKANLLEPSFENAGHISMGKASAFDYDPDLFLRFYVDHANHPEWDLGVFGNSVQNAPPLSMLPENQSDELRKIINEFYERKFESIDEVAVQIQDRVHKKTLEWNSLAGSGHYQAVSVKTIAGIRHWLIGEIMAKKEVQQQRVELRGSYGQISYLQFQRYAQFLEARLNFLKKEQNAGVLIEYAPTRANSFSDEEKISLFKKELEKMGLSFNEYKILLHPKVRGSYEGGSPVRSCSAVLSSVR